MGIRLAIKDIAEKQGINQSRLQIKAGVTLPLLSRYWNNKTESVTLDALDRIAKALGVKPGELLVEGGQDGEEKERPAEP